MNPKSFPERLDSKTSCLRITVPENLDLALEGLIRKVLKEQPKTDEVYSFAADYFETLLRIRDEAGAKFTAAQLCPFHNDEEAREMIILAGTFSGRGARGRRRVEGGRGFRPPKTKTLERTKKVDEAALERSAGGSFGKEKPDKEKQATPDLIKKLPVSVGRRPEGAGTEAAKEQSEEGEEEEEGLPTSDPIKELVDKELSGAEKKGPRTSEGGSPERGVGEEDSGRPERSERKVGTPAPLPAGEEGPGDVKEEAREEDKVDAEASEAPREVATKVAEDSEKGKADEARREPEGGRIAKKMQSKEGKENGEEIDALRTDEGPQKIESGPTKESAPEALDEPLPGEPSDAEGKNSPTTVEEMPGNGKTEIAEANPEGRGEALPETASETSSRPERGAGAVGSTRPRSGDESAADASPTPAPSPAAEKGSDGGETGGADSLGPDSQEAGGVEKDEAAARDAGKGIGPEAEEKKPSELVAGSTARDERAGGDPPKRENIRSESAVPPEGNKPDRASTESERDARSPDEEGLREKRNEDTDGGGENPPPERDDPKKLSAKREEELTSAGAFEARENAAEAERNLENVAAAADSEDGSRETKAREASEKHDRAEEGGGILVTEQLPEGEKSAEAAGPEQDEEDEKAEDQVTVKGHEPPEDQAERSPTAPEERTEKEDESTSGPGLPSADEEREREVPEAPASGPKPPADPETSARKTDGEAPEEEGDRPRDLREAPSSVEEELCTVVDVSNLPKGEAPVAGSPERSGRAESPTRGKSAAEQEDDRDSSGTRSEPRENSNLEFDLDVEAEEKKNPEAVQEDESEGLPGATPARREPVDEENDGAPDFEERLVPDSRGPGTLLSGFHEREERSEPGDPEPSEAGKHVVIIEEPERVQEGAEESPPAAGIQIKTIQTHYYDSLRVPEILTREYRVHGLAVPGPSTAIPADGNGVPPSAGTVEALGLEEFAEHGAPESAGDGREGTSPGPDDASQISEFGVQKTCRTFLSNERLFSSLEKEQIRLVAPQTAPTADESETLDPTESERESDGFVPEKATTSAEETPPAPPSETEKDPAGAGSPAPAAEVSPDRRRESDGTCAGEAAVASGAPKGDAEKATEVRDEAEEELLEGKTGRRRDSESGPGEPPGEASPRERTAVGEGSSGETDSTSSSAATEIKRSDSAAGGSASAARPPSSRSLDLGDRIPLTRSRSLSTHLRGAADFDVWSTIERELEEAATKIQSKYRGYKTRKKLRRENAVQIPTEESSRRTTPVEAEDGDDRRRATGEFHDVIVLEDHPR